MVHDTVIEGHAEEFVSISKMCLADLDRYADFVSTNDCPTICRGSLLVSTLPCQFLRHGEILNAVGAADGQLKRRLKKLERICAAAGFPKGWCG